MSAPNFNYTSLDTRYTTPAAVDAKIAAQAALNPGLKGAEYPGGIVELTANYTMQLSDAGKMIIYNVSSTAATFNLPTSNIPAGWTVSVSQGWGGKVTVTSVGSQGLDGIRTSSGIVNTVTTNGSGTVLKFVKDNSTRWFLLPYSTTWTTP